MSSNTNLKVPSKNIQLGRISDHSVLSIRKDGPSAQILQAFRGHTNPTQLNVSDITQAVSGLAGKRKTSFKGNEAGLIRSIKAGPFLDVKNAILQYFIEEFCCTSCAILSIQKEESEFKVFIVDDNDHSKEEKRHPNKMFTGVLETLSSKNQCPTVFHQNCEPWKQIFEFTPTCLFLVPVFLSGGQLPLIKRSIIGQRHKSSVFESSPRPPIDTITVLAFTTELLPEMFVSEDTWDHLMNTCKLISPILINAERFEKSRKRAEKIRTLMEGIRNVEKQIQDLNACIHHIGYEIQSIFGATHTVIFMAEPDIYEPRLVKYTTIDAGRIGTRCPDKNSHSQLEFLQNTKFPAGWSALNKKTIIINSQAQFEKVCGNVRMTPLHSVSGCLVRNMMCIFIEDVIMNSPIIVEISDKSEDFSEEDEQTAQLLSKHLSNVFSAATMLEYRRNAIRRLHITNEILNNITKVQFTKVKPLLDFKFQYTNSFQKKFNTIKFTFNIMPKEQYAGVILYIFRELGFIETFKIRKATLIRFILSVNQGYIENPYHNWKHACTVTHFAYLLLKKMELQKHGYLTELEALSLIVGCICHDIGHRGVNNHFSGCVNHKNNEDPYHLLAHGESLVERHHVAIAIQILSAEDCNIIENLTDTQFKEFIDLIQWNIIATDLGKHLYERFDNFHVIKKFSKRKKEHRKVFLSLLMTACDLCETVKPWGDYLLTVKNIFSEFFTEGDEELRIGLNPSPIMDRRICYIPYVELKFVNEIVRPVFETLAKFLPKMKQCLFEIDYIKELWLVATQVFDDNIRIQDPLEVLDFPEMKEDKLKKEANPQLEQEVTKIRQSIVSASLIASPLQDFGPLRIISIRASMQGEKSEEKFYKELYGSQWRQFKTSFKDFCCCAKCRFKALYDANFVRKTHHETDFMESRSEHYEHYRIAEFFNGVYESEQTPRERIQSLINPVPLVECSKSIKN